MKSTSLGAIRRYLSAFLAYVSLVAFVPIILIKTEAELGRQNELWLYVTVWLSFVALINLCLGRDKIRLTLIDLLVLSLFLWLGVSYFYVADINASTKWIQALGVFTLYFNLRILGNYHKNLWRWTFCLIVFCGLSEAFIGIKQALGLAYSNHPLFKATGTFYNPGPYGGFLAVAMSMAAGYLVSHYESAIAFFKEKDLKNWRGIMSAGIYLLCAASFILSFIIIFSTGSRAAILAFMVCAGVIIITKYRHDVVTYFREHKKISALIFAAIIIVASIGAFGIYNAKKGSADARVLTWGVMARSIAENPLFGTGFGSFEGEYATKRAEYFAENPSSRYIPVADATSHGFNEYLQIGMETGITGLLLALSIMTIAFIRLFRSGSPFAYGLLAFMIFALFSYPFSLIPFQVILILFLAFSTNNTTAVDSRKSLCIGRGVVAASSIIFIFLMLFMLPHYREKIAATKEWKEIGYFYRLGLYEDCLSDYAKIYPMLFDNPRFLFEYGHSLNKTADYIKSSAILKEGARLSNDPMFLNIMGSNHKALGEYEAAESNYRAAFEMVPNRIYPLYLLMNLYNETGRNVEARTMAHRVLEFNPKVESQATNQMKEEADAVLSL